MDHDKPGKGTLNVSMQEYVDALVEPVTSRIRAGDVTLREYIERILEEYRRQMARALADAERIEVERFNAIRAVEEQRWGRIEEQVATLTLVAETAINQLRRERELVTSAQAVAIAKTEQSTAIAIEKAERATDKRFESVNEFRSQQTDIINRFLPREVADAQFADIRRSLAELTEKLSKLT